MIVDNQPAQPNIPLTYPTQQTLPGGVPVAKDLRFATDHGVLAPHEQPSFPPTASTVQPIKPFSGFPEENHPQTLYPPNSSDYTSSQTRPFQASSPIVAESLASSPLVQQSITSQTPVSTDLSIGISTESEHSQAASKVGIKDVMKWGVSFALAGVGMKGFSDALYFITVEFQNFEKALENHFVETATFSSLIMKASFLIFATALSTFFGMQLVMTNTKKMRLLKLISSIIVGVSSFLVIEYASTINVLDTFK